jgi:hypothetical protein
MNARVRKIVIWTHPSQRIQKKKKRLTPSLSDDETLRVLASEAKPERNLEGAR